MLITKRKATTVSNSKRFVPNATILILDNILILLALAAVIYTHLRFQKTTLDPKEVEAAFNNKISGDPFFGTKIHYDNIGWNCAISKVYVGRSQKCKSMC